MDSVMKERDIHFTDKQGNEYFVMVREEKVEVWRNKEQIHDVRFYEDELTVVDEEKIYFTYSFLRRKLDWEKFCDLTGTSFYAIKEGFEFKDNEIYYITKSKAKQFNLI